MSVDSTTAPKARSDVLFRQLEDEWVLFDPQADELHVLNLSAALVWTHCDGARDVRGIAEAVAGAFEPPVPSGRVERDVDATLARFRDAGLLE